MQLLGSWCSKKLLFHTVAESEKSVRLPLSLETPPVVEPSPDPLEQKKQYPTTIAISYQCPPRAGSEIAKGTLSTTGEGGSTLTRRFLGSGELNLPDFVPVSMGGSAWLRRNP